MESLPDTVRALREQVQQAAADGTRLRPRGGASKQWLDPRPGHEARVLDMRAHAGVLAYEPSELYVTARAGTALVELEAMLARQGQCLPCDPPRFVRDGGAGATVGGMVAAGLSGPGRLGAGAVRDYVLGASLLNGRGEVLHFGGQVMKNVAGYDVSRLLAGSMGSLGVILEVSLKVLPLPRAQATLAFEMPQQQATEQLNRWGGQPLPISASAWWVDADGRARLYLRLRGARAAVDAACSRLGGERVDDAQADALWESLRDQTLDWFAPTWQPAPAQTLWRIAVPQTAPVLDLPGQTLVEWGGSLRWLRSDADASAVRDAAARVGGHATRFRGGGPGVPVFTPPQAPLERIQRQVKLAFDPHGVFPDCFGAA